MTLSFLSSQIKQIGNIILWTIKRYTLFLAVKSLRRINTTMKSLNGVLKNYLTFHRKKTKLICFEVKDVNNITLGRHFEVLQYHY